MFNKVFSNIINGLRRGVLVAILTGFSFPLFFEVASIIGAGVTDNKFSTLSYFTYPGIYLVASALAFVFYVFPCVVIGIALTFLFERTILSKWIFAAISGIMASLLWYYYSFGPSLDLNAIISRLILILMIILFHYICFFIWLRPSSTLGTPQAVMSNEN